MAPISVDAQRGRAIVYRGNALFASGGGRVMYALDTKDGRTLWSHDIGRTAYSVPSTYVRAPAGSSPRSPTAPRTARSSPRPRCRSG